MHLDNEFVLVASSSFRASGGGSAASEALQTVSLFRALNKVDDIRSAVFVTCGNKDAYSFKPILETLNARHRFLGPGEEALLYILDAFPDIVFIACLSDESDEERFSLCRKLRSSDYRGIVVLITDSTSEYGDTSKITSEGFDNYILDTDSPGRIRDTIQWAVLNRKRRNKYIIQFDENPDSLYTVDRRGNIYDINRGAVGADGISPRDVVIKRIRIDELETLSVFRSHIQPLITRENIGRVFSQTVDEVDSVFQVKTTVHNVPTIGLVATVVKTDITKTIYSRSMDILVNSITMLSQRDNYTAAHSSRVFYYCTRIAAAMGFGKDKKSLRSLYFASLLHDIGKIGIRDNILLKPRNLTDRDFRELATHPIKGFEMLKPYRFLHDSIHLVRSHHERPDGKGYPDGLGRSDIPYGAAIIAVADCFDAMTTDRPYRKFLSFENAVSEIRHNLGSQFDREAGKAFLSAVTPKVSSEIKTASKKPLGVISQELLDTVLSA